ncbi:response regulator transcription factor [Naumannella huperziae]
MSEIGVLVVDDQAMVRAGIRALLELGAEGDDRGDRIVVTAEAANGVEALEALRAADGGRIDVVLMDIRMPVLDGIGALQALRARDDTAAVPVIMLTTFDSDELLFDSLEAGAAGFMRKDLEPAELHAAVRRAHAGEAVLDPAATRLVVRRALAGRARAAEAERRIAGLSGRERDMLAWVGRGLSNDEIAAQLSLSPGTARTYVSKLLTRLDCRDRVALVVLAHAGGLV